MKLAVPLNGHLPPLPSWQGRGCVQGLCLWGPWLSSPGERHLQSSSVTNGLCGDRAMKCTAHSPAVVTRVTSISRHNDPQRVPICRQSPLGGPRYHLRGLGKRGGRRATSSALIHDSEEGPQTGAGSGKAVDSSGREKSGLGTRLGAAQAGGSRQGLWPGRSLLLALSPTSLARPPAPATRGYPENVVDSAPTQTLRLTPSGRPISPAQRK